MTLRRSRSVCSLFRVVAALALVLAPVEAAAQFVIEGVIHDGQSLAPLGDVVVFLAEDGGAAGLISPGALVDPAQQGQITGPDGRYRFDVAEVTTARIQLERPDARFAYPSGARPPEGGGRFGGLACETVPCPGGLMNPDLEPTPTSRYALRFRTAPTGPGARNNHVPVDALDRLVDATLTADRSRARRGSTVTYTLAVANRASSAISDVEVVLTLPEQMRLAQDGWRVAIRDADGNVRPSNVEARQADLQIRIGPLQIPSGGRVEVRAPSTVVRRTEQIFARAQAFAEQPGGIRLSNEAVAEVRIEADPTLERSTIYGRVYCVEEGGRAHWQDANEPGLFGARVYLDTGFFADTDADGRFHFSGVPEGSRLLKIDTGALPPGSALAGPERVQLYLSPGTPAKVRFEVACALEPWTTPTRVKTAPRPLPPGPTGPITLPVAVDAIARTVALQDSVHGFMTPRLDALPTDQGARLMLSSDGRLLPSRWRVRVQELGPQGEVLRELGDESFTGRGLPPLFIDFTPDRPPRGAYVASLELRALDADEARTPKVMLPRPGIPAAQAPPMNLGTIRSADDRAADVQEILPLVIRSLSRPGITIRLRGHWERGPEAEANSRREAEAAQQTLLASGVPADRVSVEAVGDREPKFPSLLARLRRKNRRVDVIRVPAPIIPPPKLELGPVPPRSVIIGVDQREASVPLEDPAARRFTVDLDPPARLEATLHDGRGGWAMLRRSVVREGVLRPGARQSVTPTVTATALDFGVAQADLPRPDVRVAGGRVMLSDEGHLLEVELVAPDDVTAWLVQLVDPSSAQVIAQAGGAGPPRPRLTLALTSSVARRRAATLHLSTVHAAGHRVQAAAVTVPPLDGDALTARAELEDDPGAAFVTLIDALARRPSANLVVRVDGGARAERDGARQALIAALDARGLSPDRLQWTAGRPDGGLLMEAHLLEQVAIEGAAIGYGGTLRPRGAPSATGPMEVSGQVLELGDGARVVLPIPDIEALPYQQIARAGPVEPAPTPIEEIPAASVELRMPRQGSVLDRLQIPVSGQTRAQNRIRINGEDVAVSEDGRFAVVVPLEPGANRLVVESRDEAGNQVAFERTVQTSSSGWFLMALAEGQVSTGGARLAGSGEHTRVDAGPLSLDGRLVAYGRARWAWSDIGRLSLKGRFDSAERGGSDPARLEDDPFRLLPAFGDGSVEVQDTASRHKIFLDATLDDSRLTLGNATTTLSSFGADGLFAFRQSGFGVHADLQRSFTDVDDTEVRAVVLLENGGVARGHDELQGTGGSFFWLSQDEILEGSEQVRLLVRDRDTGQILFEEAKVRGQDYELRPREGRLSFRRPVPHVVGFADTSMNRSVVMTGHPVFVVVDYAYQRDAGDVGAFGVQVRETLFDQVELVGGIAGEDGPTGEGHRLYGIGLAWRPTAASFVELEYARSKGQTTAGRLSWDGGLTFLDLDAALTGPDAATTRAAQAPFFGALNPEAWGATLQLGLEDLFEGHKGHVRAYGRRVGLYFSTAQSARQRGRLEGGVRAAYEVTRGLQLRASLDAARVASPEIGAVDGEVSSLLRVLFVAGADYRDEANAATVELAHVQSRIATDPDRDGSATGVSGRYERRVTERLTLSLGQEALLDTDAFTQDDLGRLATTVGARWDLTERLSVDVAEMVRWNGDNATQVGLRVTTEEGLSAYVAERVGRFGGAPMVTTVIGAEDQVSEGSRTYGELQVDGIAHPQASRAVLGMDNRWEVYEGLDLLLAYERAQLTGGTPVTQAAGASPYTSMFGGLSQTLGGFGSAVQLLPGAVSRDALAVGFVYRGWSRLRLSSRFEVRRDDGDDERGSDYLSLGYHGGFLLSLSEDVSAQGRLTVQHVQDTLRNVQYAKWVEGSLGAVYRPRHSDWFTMVVRYTKLISQRPAAGGRRSDNRDALSVEPIIDTPWRVQLVERVALVHDRASQDDSGDVGGLSVLWVNRLNGRILDQLEAAVEYRMLSNLAADTTDRGVLVEVGYLPDERVRIGVGYNFTRFSDDVLVLASEDAAGPFLRVTGRY